MIRYRIYFAGALVLTVLSLLLHTDFVSYAQSSQTSQLVTLTCTGSPCNWGASPSGPAIVWPASMAPSTQRLGYTASAGMYLPASAASGMTIGITSGTAVVYAGLPNAASFRILATLPTGQSYTIAGLAAGEVVAVQSSPNHFAYTLTMPPVATATPTPTVVATAVVPPGSTGSQLVTLTCTGSPCNWGASVSGPAIVWPASMAPSTQRLGYTASAGMYLPASAASGMTIALTSGTAVVYAGLPDAASFRILATLPTGQSYTIAGLAAGEVVAVQSSPNHFAYTLTMPPVATATPTPTVVATAVVPPGSTGSQLVTLTCTGSPCNWGASVSGPAIVWPASMAPSTQRLGYTASAGVYLPASAASGMTIALTSGTAVVYAGLPDAASFRILATLPTGQSYTIAGLAAGEMVTVQSSQNHFAYTLTMPPAATATPTPTPTVVATAVVPPGSTGSQLVTLTCTGSPCNWGASVSGPAIVWPASMAPSTQRLGYTASAGVYLPESAASGMTIALTSGTAIVYAGLPDAASFRVLATLSTGQSYTIAGLVVGEVVTVQGSQSPFAYTLTMPPPVVDPTATPVGCVDPTTCNPVSLVPAYWRCNIPGCTYSDWVGEVVSWPSWSAYDSNARAGDQSRTVFSSQGERLYPYMGLWATGCQVTAVTGTVVVIEWQRGTDVWRQTYLQPGQSHIIAITSPEDGALIEGSTSPASSVSLTNCNPQAIPMTPTPMP